MKSLPYLGIAADVAFMHESGASQSFGLFVPRLLKTTAKRKFCTPSPSPLPPSNAPYARGPGLRRKFRRGPQPSAHTSCCRNTRIEPLKPGRGLLRGNSRDREFVIIAPLVRACVWNHCVKPQSIQAGISRQNRVLLN